MQKNTMVTVTIEDLSIHGEGIGKVNGFPLFIKGGLIGDVIEVKIIKLKKQYGYGRIVKIITPSSHRVEPLCPIAEPCGGCQLQSLTYSEQLSFKDKKVRNNLERIGGFSASQLEQVLSPTISMEEPYRYRNKAQFPFGTDKSGQPITGFYAGRTHEIIPNTDCIIGVEVNKEILEIILGHMKKYHIPSYDESTGSGLIRHALIRYGFATGEIMVCLVVNGKGKNVIPQIGELLDELSQISGMKSICQSSNTKQTNVIMGHDYDVLWGQSYITDYIGEVAFQISPLSFYQVNPVQTKVMYDLALEYADLKGHETVWDLYCGIGTISLFLSQQAKQVHGVEIVPQAIEDAKENARINGIDNVEFLVGKAEEVLPEYCAGAGVNKQGESEQKIDVVVVDPPRKGCAESLLDTIAKVKSRRVVYVSCDSATLARDLKYLCERGYELRKVQPVDNFPQGVHVECVVLMMRGVK